MPDRVITAEALITARDGTGDVFINLARKIDQVGKSAKVSADVERLSQALGQASKTAAQIDGFKVASKGLDAASLAMGRAKQEAGKLAKEIAGMDKPTATLTGKLAQAEKEVDRSTAAFKRQGSVVRDARAALEAAGVPINKLGAEQQRLKGIIEGTTSAIERQIDVERRAAVEAERVAAAEKQRAAAEQKAEAVAEREAHLRSHGIAHHGFGNYVAGAAAGAVSAHGVMSALEKALEAGAERQSTLVGMKNAGMGDDEIKRAESMATTVSRDAPNLDVSQILELHKEARSAVQHPEEVFELMPDLARATSVLKGLGADNANIADLVKAGESLGLMNDPKRFHAFLDAQVRAMKVMGKTITTEQVYEAAKYTKSAGATLSDDFLNLTMPSLIQEMHGSSAGDALSAIAKRWRGGLAHQHLAVTQLDHMGLLQDPSKIVRAKKSGEIMGYTGKLKGDELLGTDPDRFFREVWEPAAEKMGAKTLADKIKLLNETLPGTAANAGRIFLQQSETLKQHRENYKNAPDLERSVELQKHDPKVAMQTFTAALNDLEAAVTGPTMDALSLGLGRLSGTLRDLADAAEAHPNIAVGAGVAATAGGLLGSGYLAYQISQGFGLRTSADRLTVAAEMQMEAARLGGAHGGPGGGSSGGPAGKPSDGKSGSSGYGLGSSGWFAALGLGSLALGAPGIDEAGDKRREANAAALDKLGNGLGFGYVDGLRERMFGKNGDLGTWIGGLIHGGSAGVPLPPDRYATTAPNSDGNALRRWDERPVGGPAVASHPDDDRLSRARASDADALDKLKDDFGLTGFVMGQLHDKTGIVLTGFDTLGTHTGTLGGSLGDLAQAAGLAAEKLNALANFGGSGEGSGGFGGGAGNIVKASYGGEGFGAGNTGTPRLRSVSRGTNGPNPYAGGEPGGTFVPPVGVNLPAGMRQNNMGNIGFFGQRMAGLLGPSNAHDVDHSIARFATQEDGIRAAAALALAKYHKGRHTTWDIIAAAGGWTPGKLGPGASVNVARAMGVGNRDAINLDDEGQLVRFLHGLAVQEHGTAGRYYSEDRIRAALHHKVLEDEHPALKAPPRRPPPPPVSNPGATTAQLEGQAHVRVEIVAKDHAIAGTYVGSRGHIRGSVGTTTA